MFTKEKDMSKVFGPRNWLKNVGKKNPTFFFKFNWFYRCHMAQRNLLNMKY